MRKLEIKETIIKEWELTFSIASIIMVSIKIKNLDFLIVFPIALLLYVTYSIINRLKDRKSGIVIDKYGIQLKSENKSFLWEVINDAEVQDLSGGKIILRLKTKSSHFQTDLSNFDTTSYKIEEAIVFFSNGKIKGRETKLYNSINDLVSDKENLEVIIDLFNKHKRKGLWVLTLIFFGGLALSIYFQVSYPFPFSFAIGWAAIIIVMYHFNKNAESTLRHSDKIRQLTDNQFNEIAIKFKLRNKDDKQNKRFAMVFMVFMSIGIFIISYFLSR